MIRKMVRRELLHLVRPQHGGEVWKHNPPLIDFSCNLNPLGPPEEAIKIIQQNLDYIINYPDDQCTRLKSTLSDYLDVPLGNIIVGCGSTELIKAFAEAFVKPSDHVIVCSPTYDEYAFYCQFMGGIVDRFPLSEDKEFCVETDSLLELVGGGTKAVFLCNPNNPTSRFENKNKILEVVEECGNRSVLVFIDEAFIEFLREGKGNSCVSEVQNYDNLFVSRSLTKIFSIPGIRVGYGVGGEEIIKYMDKARLSWNVGVLEQALACGLIGNCHSYLERTVRFVETEKRRMYEKLSRIMGYQPVRPDANFIFVKIKELGVNSTTFKNIMLNHGFLIRDCSSFGEAFSNYIRIAIKKSEQNSSLLEKLKAVSEEILSSDRKEFEAPEKSISKC
ncbi:MAG: histidinol-phosphate transaminase [Candidatus Jordarchaeaceae archaeon]